MTAQPEQSKPQEETQSPDAIREAIGYGIDISLLRANLALRPAERIRRHQIALNTGKILGEAKFSLAGA